MAPAGAEQMLADATFAVAAEPAWSPWRGTALLVLAEADQLVGDVDGARASFTACAALGATLDNADNYILSQGALAMWAMDHGDWQQAADHVALGLAAIEEHRMADYSTSIRAFAAAARLAVHRGQLDLAHRELTRAMRARPAATFALPWIAVGSRLQVAAVYLSIDDPTTARHLLREVDDILLERPDVGVLTDDAATLRQSLSAISRRAVGSSPLSPAELRLLPYLQTHLTFREIAERLYVSRNTVSSQTSSIYRKLGVSSRSEAIERATESGLIGN